jgi:hypothetical protein
MEVFIERFHNRASKPLSVNKRQMMFIYKGHISVAFQETPHQIEDVISYDRISKINNFKVNKSTQQADAVAISIKGDERPTISFRVSAEAIASELVALVIRKINDINNLPDFSDLLQHREQIIQRIKETEPEYMNVFNAFTNGNRRIPAQKLKVILF